jgi:hypothetical protein
MGNIPVIKHAVMISFLVFLMMLFVDFINTATQGRILAVIQGEQMASYTLSSFLGSTPGCVGAFMNVSLYIHGMISFGALVGGMIATCGDEAFVMLTQFPGTTIFLFFLLFVSGIFFTYLSDKLIKLFQIAPCESCLESHCELCMPNADGFQRHMDIFRITNLYYCFRHLSFIRTFILLMIISFLNLILIGILGPSGWGLKRITFISFAVCSLVIVLFTSDHYLHSHIWNHIIKRHLFRVFIWSFGALIFVHWGLSFWNLDTLVREHLVCVLFVAALVGIIPESGPHLIFVMMYAQGLFPFSVLFTTSFVQDGHGMLPLLSYSIGDSLLVKVFNLVFGIAMGIVFWLSACDRNFAKSSFYD